MCHAIVSVAKKRHHSRLKRKKNQALPQPFEEKKNQDVVKQAAMAKWVSEQLSSSSRDMHGPHRGTGNSQADSAMIAPPNKSHAAHSLRPGEEEKKRKTRRIMAKAIVAGGPRVNRPLNLNGRGPYSLQTLESLAGCIFIRSVSYSIRTFFLPGSFRTRPDRVGG